MKSILKSFFGAVLMLMISMVMTRPCAAQQFPKPSGYVNDFAHLLTQEEQRSLNDELIAFEKKTSVEVAVVIVPSLDGRDIDSYATSLGEEWGVGKRSQNNGVIFLVATNDHKMIIKTASGARTILTDERADQIRDTVVLPRFRSGKMPQGITAGTHEIISVFSSVASPVSSSIPMSHEREVKSNSGVTAGEMIVSVLIALIVLGFCSTPFLILIFAKKSFFRDREILASKISEMEELVKHEDVSTKTRSELTSSKATYSRLRDVTKSSKNVCWVSLAGSLDVALIKLSFIPECVEADLAYAKEAREKGPELMEQLPAIIDAAKKRLSLQEQDEVTSGYLNDAEEQYARAKKQMAQSEMMPINWVILYALLSGAQENVASAEHPPTPMSNTLASGSGVVSSGVTPQGGFGANSNFGMGGGFSVGGGGSTGSW